MKKAIFIDKDGVIVDSKGCPYQIPTDNLYPHSFEGLKAVSDSEYLSIIVSNQSWVSRNRMSHSEVTQVFQNIKDNLKKKDIHIDDFYFCPHSHIDNCRCRKPEPGMILEAAEKHGIDIKNSVMIGDRTGDIELGKRLGMKTILVKTGNAGKDLRFDAQPDHIAENFTEAVKIILSR